MSDFEPELGQILFSNAKMGGFGVPELFEAALSALASEIERVEWNNTQEHFEAPTSNNGGEYKTDKFKMKAYCWCDGERHPKGCPANFEWRKLKVSWYKYLGRGMSANYEITPDMTAQMLEECLASVRAKEKDILSAPTAIKESGEL